MDLKVLIIIGALAFLALIIFIFRKNMGAFFRFLVSKLFLINLILALAVAFLVPYCSIKGLDDYTNHGIKVEVPYVVGMHVNEIPSKFEGADLEYVIIDSSFNDNFPAGTIFQQDPDPKLNYDSVKPGRKIYLYMVKKGGEYKNLPNLTGDFTKPSYVAKINLESMGFKTQLKPVAGDKDEVLRIEDLSGKELKPDQKLLKGSTVVIVHGTGKDGEAVTLPNVKGLTVMQAQQVLAEASLKMEINYEPAAANYNDSTSFKITYQSPTPISIPQGIVPSGSTVTIIAKPASSGTPQ